MNHSASFNTVNGTLTLTRDDASTAATVNLDGRYLTTYTETDPIFNASAAAGIGSPDIVNWNTAFGWGDHSTQVSCLMQEHYSLIKPEQILQNYINFL